MFNDTIAAIASPLGEGGLAVIRLSGSSAFSVADQCFRMAGSAASNLASVPTHTLHYGHIVRQGRVIDEVMVAVMKAPRTYTCEDVLEITCHGGMLPAKLVLDTTLECGARLAHPGEFTRRAFLNGRIDLAQAEAVTDLIHARTDLALAAANEQLAGKLSRRIHLLRDELMRVLAHVEAHIDFPEEDILPDTRMQLVSHVEHSLAFMDELLRTADEGRILRKGVRAAIIGRPNVGKSSLLNQLLGHERAIVSPIAGTTRDTIEETANVRGIPIVFIDTAGLRVPSNEIEAEGIRRSRETLAKAELVLHVLDSSLPFSVEDSDYLAEFADKKRLLIKNKADMPLRLELPAELQASVASVSCRTGEGVEQLKDAIKNLVWSGELGGEMTEVMINSRHQDALRRARIAAETTREALMNNLTLELVAMDLRIAVNAVGEVVGKTTTEDLLDSIFNQFCIGK